MPPKKKIENESILDKEITLKELKEVVDKCYLKWSERRIQQKVKEGYPKGKGRGKYPVIQFLLKIIEDTKLQAETESGNKSKSDYETTILKYKAKREEIIYKKEIASIITVDEHQDAIEKIVNTIVSQLDSIPKKAAAKYANAKSIELKNGLEELIKTVKNDLSNYDKYGISMADDKGSAAKQTRSRKKSTATVQTKRKTTNKRVGK